MSRSADALPARLVIASRESRLAMWQAEHVQARLRALHPAMDVQILGMTTQGDQVLDRALSEIGGKGLFTKELEQALLDGRADLAVHSLKDVPMVLPEGFALAAIMQREDPRDAFVSGTYPSLGALPPGAKVGTSSLRRAAQLRARYPHLEVLSLRGNVNTRLAKLDAGQYDAIILAAAGLKRLGLFTRIRSVLPPATSLPAVGQGALAIEVLAGRADVFAAVAPLVDVATTLQVSAERALARKLGGNCRMPLAAFCETDPDGALVLAGLVAMPDGSRMVHARATGRASAAGAEALGLEVAASLLAQGADEILKTFA